MAYLDKNGLQYFYGKINNILNTIVDNLANQYDSESTYEVGDKCLHDNQLYACNTNISTAESWNSQHWDSIKVLDNMNMQPILSAVDADGMGNIVLYSSKLSMCYAIDSGDGNVALIS